MNIIKQKCCEKLADELESRLPSIRDNIMKEILEEIIKDVRLETLPRGDFNANSLDIFFNKVGGGDNK